MPQPMLWGRTNASTQSCYARQVAARGHTQPLLLHTASAAATGTTADAAAAAPAAAAVAAANAHFGRVSTSDEATQTSPGQAPAGRARHSALAGGLQGLLFGRAESTDRLIWLPLVLVGGLPLLHPACLAGLPPPGHTGCVPPRIQPPCSRVFHPPLCPRARRSISSCNWRC